MTEHQLPYDKEKWLSQHQWDDDDPFDLEAFIAQELDELNTQEISKLCSE